MVVTYETRKALVEQAQNFEYVEDFMDYVGWDGDWMPDLLENPECEELSVNDYRAINEVLVSAYEEAHKMRFERTRRWGLLNR